MIQRINEALKDFYDYTNSAQKLNGTETRRKLAALCSTIERISSEFNFDITLQDSESKEIHDICLQHYCRACRSPKEARWTAFQIAKAYRKFA